MSSYGMKIFKDDGSLFISPDVTPLNYIGKIKYRNTSQTYTIPTIVPSDKSIRYFINTTSGSRGGAIVKAFQSGGFWHLEFSRGYGEGYVYIFSNMVTKSSGYGIATYNSNGEMMWNTDMIPLQMFQTSNPSTITENTELRVPVGVNVAVSPGLCSTYLMVIDPYAGIVIYGGMYCTGVNSDIVISNFWSKQSIEGGVGNPPVRYKENLLYIDTSMYP